VEDLADLDHAGNLLALLGRQHAGQGSLDLIDCVVNHVVVTDIDTEGFGQLAGTASARMLKPMMTAPEACARLTSDSLIAPTAPWIIWTRTSSLDSLAASGPAPPENPARPP
jgi:hypothetical protein